MPKLDLPRNGALARLFDEAGLTLVDVGARGEPRGEVRPLAPFSRLVGFEADAVEARRLAAELEQVGAWREVEVVPHALGAEGTPRTLYLTEQAGLSSLHPPDETVVGRYWFADAFRVRGTANVETTTLDAAADAYGFDEACFIKLDTQGTELEILRSGEQLLTTAVQAVLVEANFHPLYQGQDVFADVDTYLRDRGFVLVDLRKTEQRGAAHRPDAYSRRQVTWAHCLYVRDVARVTRAAATGEAAAVVLAARWLCLVLAFEHFDLALALLAEQAARDGLSERYGAELAADVDRLIAAATRRRLRKAGADPETLLGTTARG